MKNGCLYKSTKTKSIYFHFGIPSQRLTTTSKCSTICAAFTITKQDGVRDYQGETATMIQSVQERLELTGSNGGTIHILVLIWFLLFKSSWSIYRWEMSGAFVDVSRWRSGRGAGHQLKNEGVDLTHHPEFTTWVVRGLRDHRDLRDITGDLLFDMTWSVMVGVWFWVASETGLLWCYMKSLPRWGEEHIYIHICG